MSGPVFTNIYTSETTTVTHNGDVSLVADGQGKSPDEIEMVLEMTSERGPWWAKQAS